MTTAKCLFPAIGLTLVLAAPAAADGWSLPGINFFQREKAEASPEAARPAPEAVDPLDEQPPTSGFRLPKFKTPSLLPARRPEKPSIFQRIGRGTKNLLTKTKDALTPWDSSDDAPPSRSVTGSRRVYDGSPGADADTDEKKSLFSSWFSGGDKEEEPKTPRTVNDFISQPRPRF